MGIVPTVKVVHEDGFCVINESDFDSQVHTRYTEAPGQPDADSGESPNGGFAYQVINARVAEGAQMIAESEDRVALEQLAEKAERKTIRRAASRRLEALG